MANKNNKKLLFGALSAAAAVAAGVVLSKKGTDAQDEAAKRRLKNQSYALMGVGIILFATSAPKLLKG